MYYDYDDDYYYDYDDYDDDNDDDDDKDDNNNNILSKRGKQTLQYVNVLARIEILLYKFSAFSLHIIS